MLRGIWILIGETFPTRTRAKQGALSTSSNWLFNFLLAFFTPFIAGDINFRYGFVFAGKQAGPTICRDFALLMDYPHSVQSTGRPRCILLPL